MSYTEQWAIRELSRQNQELIDQSNELMSMVREAIDGYKEMRKSRDEWMNVAKEQCEMLEWAMGVIDEVVLASVKPIGDIQ